MIVPSSSGDTTTDHFCRNLKTFTDDVTKETKHLDNLLKNLREYYKEVKTRRQLNLDVPAGFRRDSNTVQNFRDFQLGNRPVNDNFTLSLPDSASSFNLLSQTESVLPNQEDCDTNASLPTITNESTGTHIPILRCVDKASSSLLNWLMFTEDIILLIVADLK